MFTSWKSTVTSEFTIFADHVGSSKIFVHISEEEMDSIPVYEEVFSSDEEEEDPEDADGKFFWRRFKKKWPYQLFIIDILYKYLISISRIVR